MTNQSGHNIRHHLFIKKLQCLLHQPFNKKKVPSEVCWMLAPVHNPAFFTEKQKKGKEYNGNKAEVRLHKQGEKETSIK